MPVTWEQTTQTATESMSSITWFGLRTDTGFIMNGVNLGSASFYVKKNGSPNFDMYADHYNSSGTLISSSDAVNTSVLTDSFAWIGFTFSTANTISDDDYIMIRTVPDTSDYIICGRTATATGDAVQTYYSNSPFSPLEDTNRTPTMKLSSAGTPATSGLLNPPPYSEVRF